MRVKSNKAWRSTADRLSEHREGLRKHYNSLRNPKAKAFPKPSRDMFPMNIQHLVEKVEVEELKAHQRAVQGGLT